MLVSIPFTLKFNVTVESHPKLFVSVVLCVPEVENVIPFQVYGSSFSHTDRFTVMVSIPFTLKFNVTIESHPKLFVRFALCVPEDDNVIPFQVYGSSFSHTERFTVFVSVMLIGWQSLIMN